MRMAITVAMLLSFAKAAAQENDSRGVTFSGNADIVSSYIWRGMREAGVSFQPSLTMEVAGFSVTAWGSADFAGTSYREVDLSVAYLIGPVKISVLDAYCVDLKAERGLDGYGYFRYGKGSPHRVEAGIEWRISQRIPFTVAWYTTLTGGNDYDAEGKRTFASYLELSYPFSVKGIDLNAGIGIVPWSAPGVYVVDNGFHVNDIFLKAGHTWSIENAGGMKIGLFTKASWNPALEDVNVMGGISVTM